MEFLFETADALKVHDYIALILIYDISSALLEPNMAMKVILDPKMCEFKLNTIIPVQLHFKTKYGDL